jgi:hypothetical protein
MCSTSASYSRSGCWDRRQLMINPKRVWSDILSVTSRMLRSTKAIVLARNQRLGYRVRREKMTACDRPLFEEVLPLSPAAGNKLAGWWCSDPPQILVAYPESLNGLYMAVAVVVACCQIPRIRVPGHGLRAEEGPSTRFEIGRLRLTYRNNECEVATAFDIPE